VVGAELVWIFTAQLPQPRVVLVVEAPRLVVLAVWVQMVRDMQGRKVFQVKILVPNTVVAAAVPELLRILPADNKEAPADQLISQAQHWPMVAVAVAVSVHQEPQE
jgi:hypothetical protein